MVEARDTASILTARDGIKQVPGVVAVDVINGFPPWDLIARVKVSHGKVVTDIAVRLQETKGVARAHSCLVSDVWLKGTLGN